MVVAVLIMLVLLFGLKAAFRPTPAGTSTDNTNPATSTTTPGQPDPSAVPTPSDNSSVDNLPPDNSNVSVGGGLASAGASTTIATTDSTPGSVPANGAVVTTAAGASGPTTTLRGSATSLASVTSTTSASSAASTSTTVSSATTPNAPGTTATTVALDPIVFAAPRDTAWELPEIDPVPDTPSQTGQGPVEISCTDITIVGPITESTGGSVAVFPVYLADRTVVLVVTGLGIDPEAAYAELEGLREVIASACADRSAVLAAPDSSIQSPVYTLLGSLGGRIVTSSGSNRLVPVA